MNADLAKVKSKILEMFPEIKKFNVQSELSVDEQNNAYVLKLKKDQNELTTHLDANDVEDCLKGIKCIHLGVQVGLFMDWYCRSGES